MSFLCLCWELAANKVIPLFCLPLCLSIMINSFGEAASSTHHLHRAQCCSFCSMLDTLSTCNASTSEKTPWWWWRGWRQMCYYPLRRKSWLVQVTHQLSCSTQSHHHLWLLSHRWTTDCSYVLQGLTKCGHFKSKTSDTCPPHSDQALGIQQSAFSSS